LQNYYHILGLHNFATIAEIKVTFRKLAKKYHPDINPSGQEHFKSLLKVYEILSNEKLKAQYDYKLRFQLGQTQSTKQKTERKMRSKDIPEEELKRRRYYQEHYKNHYERNKKTEEIIDERKAYNEYKNILIATPLAVLLIMIVLNVWSYKPKVDVVPYDEPEPPKPEVVKEAKRVLTGDAPYSVYFGGAVQDSLANRMMQIKNMSGTDVLVLLFSKKGFVRSIYVEQGYEVSLTQLPAEIASFRIMTGDNFQYTTEMKQAGVYGAFVENCRFFSSVKKLKLNGTNQLTLLNLNQQGFKEVSEKEFFNPKSSV
jgi:curved DNA-binding protein CbpA